MSAYPANYTGPVTSNRTLLHQLWTKAVGTPGYDKSQWEELEAHINDLVRIANERVYYDPASNYPKSWGGTGK